VSQTSHCARARPSGPPCCYQPKEGAAPGWGSRHRHWASEGTPRAGTPASCPSPRSGTPAQVYNRGVGGSGEAPGGLRLLRALSSFRARTPTPGRGSPQSSGWHGPGRGSGTRGTSPWGSHCCTHWSPHAGCSGMCRGHHGSPFSGFCPPSPPGSGDAGMWGEAGD